jgi:hypothetical protein
VERSYERLPLGGRSRSRFWLLSFRYFCDDFQGVLLLLPKRFAGQFAIVELLFALEAAFSKGEA